jgi:hypothetical protein
MVVVIEFAIGIFNIRTNMPEQKKSCPSTNGVFRLTPMAYYR